jgi:hypothetical protein
VDGQATMDGQYESRCFPGRMNGVPAVFSQPIGRTVAHGFAMLHRLDRPTIVLALRDNHQAAVPIPAGKIVDVAGSGEDDRFVVVTVDGEQFHALASDLADDNVNGWPRAATIEEDRT